MAQKLVWLITGTSSGLGLRLVSSALARGDRVIATARSSPKLPSFESGCSSSTPPTIDPRYEDNLRRLELDVTQGEERLREKVKEAVSYWGRIDILVNNAGFSIPGLLEEGGSHLMRKIFETNVFGTIDLTTAALPYIRESKGWVVNVGSRSVWKPEIPGPGAYFASKAALHSYTETLGAELGPFGVRVLLVAPGAFRTEGMYGQPSFTSPSSHPERKLSEYNELREKTEKRYYSVPGTEQGDPQKAMELLVDVVREEGRAVSKSRVRAGECGYLILGEQSLDDVERKSKKLLGVVEEWRDVAGRTLNFAPNDN